MEFKAVIFDLDGTLLNTVEDLAYAMNKVLSFHNLPTHETQRYNEFIGYGLMQLVINATPSTNHKQVLIDMYLEQLIEEYRKCLNTKTRPYDGIHELLATLNQKNIPISILSNKSHQFMDEVINTYFKEHKFEYVFGARVNTPTKPDPYSAIEISQLLNIAPESIIFVGDSDIDIKTALNASMYPTGVTWGFRKKEELINAGAKNIINTPMELLQLFN